MVEEGDDADNLILQSVESEYENEVKIQNDVVDVLANGNATEDATIDPQFDYEVTGSETVINAALLNQHYLDYTYNNGSDPGGGSPYWTSGADNLGSPVGEGVNNVAHSQWNGTTDHMSPYFTSYSPYASPDPTSVNNGHNGSSYETHAYSPVDYQSTYLSHAAASAGANGPHFSSPGSSYPGMSPVTDYQTSWASGPAAAAAFDFNAMAYAGVDSMKLLEQNFNNFSLVGAAAMQHQLHDYSYPALFAANAAKPKSYASIAGQASSRNSNSGGVSMSGGNMANHKYRSNKTGGPSQSFNSSNSLNSGGLGNNSVSMAHVLDIGTWDRSDEISPANKVLTRSGKIVPTPSEKENEVLRKLRLTNNYNPLEFNCSPKDAKFFVIKSYSEDDIHRSIKYNIWCSTERGNRKLNSAYSQMQGKGPVYLLFSVNSSGHFCGVAEMRSNVDYDTQQSFWAQSKWKGSFEVLWVFVKDVPNSHFRHIRLENNENKPVTNSRDTQEIPYEKGKMMLKIFHKFEHATSLFDDFSHYESREHEVAEEQAEAALVSVGNVLQS